MGTADGLETDGELWDDKLVCLITWNPSEHHGTQQTVGAGWSSCRRPLFHRGRSALPASAYWIRLSSHYVFKDTRGVMDGCCRIVIFTVQPRDSAWRLNSSAADVHLQNRSTNTASKCPPSLGFSENIELYCYLINDSRCGLSYVVIKQTGTLRILLLYQKRHFKFLHFLINVWSAS